MNQLAAKPCPFCRLDPNRVLAEEEIDVAKLDGFPVSLGQTVLIDDCVKVVVQAK